MLVIKDADPRSLKNHPLNIQLYGEAIDAEMVESIKRDGVREPIEVTKDNIVIAGHRRRRHSVVAERKSVPIIQHTEDMDDLEIRRRLILSNRERRPELTTEQKAREYAELVRIEKVFSERRLKTSTGGTNPAPVKIPEAEKGRAKDAAAAQVGLSRPTAEKAVAVVEAIDEAAANGDTKRAGELRETLNTKPVAVAHRAAKPPKKARVAKPVDPKQPAIDLLKLADKTLGILQGHIINAAREMKKLGVEPIDVKETESHVKPLHTEVKISLGRLK